MTSDPITSWQIEENVKAVKDFILGGSKITVDSNCIHKIKRHLLFGRKAMTNLDSILKKKRHVTLPVEILIVKAIYFLVVMYGFTSWTIKKA